MPDDKDNKKESGRATVSVWNDYWRAIHLARSEPQITFELPTYILPDNLKEDDDNDADKS